MKTTYTYDHYYRYDEITDILASYARQFPSYFRLSSIGQTGKGRQIWLAEVTDLSSGDFSEKPGFALDGNIHAGEVTGSMCCMYFLDVLLTNREDEEIASLLARYTVYCVPRISADGSEAYLTTPMQLRSVDRLFPYDELQPGVQPEDLDGDGVIRQMRVKNPNGIFRKWEEDPRIMVKREPDDVCGDFYDVFEEGTVEKYDGGEVNPAPDPYGNDFNRNFPAGWGIGGHGGAYALSNPETRAFADFLQSHENLCTCLNFHTSGGLYIYPPAFEEKKKAPKEDMDRYEQIGKVCTEETGYEFVNLYEDFLGPMSAPVGGSIDDFCHFVSGMAACTCECWDLDTRCGYPPQFPRTAPPSDEEQRDRKKARLDWLAENNGGEGYSDWKEFSHPQLGTVEIGGFDVKHVIQNPPEAFLLQEVEKHTRFMLREMKMLPHLQIEDVKQRTLGEETEITAKVENTGFLPTSATEEAVKIGLVKPVTVTISGAEPVNGKEAVEIGQLAGFSESGEFGRNGAETINHAPQSKTVSFFVRAKTGDEITITASSPRAGKASQTVVIS